MNLSQAIPPDAPPSAVREYLAQYLAEKYNVPIKVAGDLVSPWKIGWGNELSYYDLETFRSLFGSEIGAILYHHVNCTRSRCASSHNCTTEEKKPGQFQSEPMKFLINIFLAISAVFALRALMEMVYGTPSGALASWKLAASFFFAFLVLFVRYHFNEDKIVAA